MNEPRSDRWKQAARGRRVATVGRLALTAIALAAASCALPSINNPVGTITSGLKHAASCRSSICASPRYRVLAAHMPLGHPTDATLEQLADANEATASKAEALILFVRTCRAAETICSPLPLKKNLYLLRYCFVLEWRGRSLCRHQAEIDLGTGATSTEANTG